MNYQLVPTFADDGEQYNSMGEALNALYEVARNDGISPLSIHQTHENGLDTHCVATLWNLPSGFLFIIMNAATTNEEEVMKDYFESNKHVAIQSEKDFPNVRVSTFLVDNPNSAFKSVVFAENKEEAALAILRDQGLEGDVCDGETLNVQEICTITMAPNGDSGDVDVYKQMEEEDNEEDEE